jgi:ribosomal protein S18 acetylase RimI-like enzyme
VQVTIVDAGVHRPQEYADFFRGHRALALVDEAGRQRAELVWRLASGHTVEITEFGIFLPADRRQGWGTRLLEAGLADMQQFFTGLGRPLRRVYAFCEATNQAGRAFYAARGFEEAARLPGFYHDGDAVLYVRTTETLSSPPLATTRIQ